MPQRKKNARSRVASGQFRPNSLLQHFEPPDEYNGTFGWLTGYSADETFMNEAVQAFSGQTNHQRAHGGQVFLAMMLDPTNPQLSFQAVPGVCHLGLSAVAEKPFRLLHAKVAILGFRHETDAQRWHVRLLVSTGNWTVGTLRNSLDLIWRIDLASEQIKLQDVANRTKRADFRSAWDFMQYLIGLFDTRVLATSSIHAGVSSPQNQLHQWLQRAGDVGSHVPSRFFDNRHKSLMDQIPRLAKKHANDVQRNYLAIGSGFYQKRALPGQIPSVLQTVADQLQQKGLLKARPEVDLIVERTACQAVATASDAIAEKGWTLREPFIPEYFGTGHASHRTLHAKFIFSANYQDRRGSFTSAWVYLGSGNMTEAGFTQRMSPQAGNLEAGVVFSPHGDGKQLFIDIRSAGSGDQSLPNLLPLQWNTQIEETDFAELQSGDEPPVAESIFLAPPVSHLCWDSDDSGHWLVVPAGEATQGYEVLDAAGEPCETNEQRGFCWFGGRPREVMIRWKNNGQTHRVLVPIIDPFGRLAATELQALDLDQAWSQLATFPVPPDNDEDSADGLESDGETPEETDDDPDPTDGSPTGRKRRRKTTSYPIREMMQFIENIAEKQSSLHPSDWSAWCMRLEQSLVQAKANPVLMEFKKLNLNPLSPLRCNPFRPTFAKLGPEPESMLYENVLDRIEQAWEVSQLHCIGEHE